VFFTPNSPNGESTWWLGVYLIVFWQMHVLVAIQGNQLHKYQTRFWKSEAPFMTNDLLQDLARLKEHLQLTTKRLDREKWIHDSSLKSLKRDFLNIKMSREEQIPKSFIVLPEVKTFYDNCFIMFPSVLRRVMQEYEPIVPDGIFLPETPFLYFSYPIQIKEDAFEMFDFLLCGRQVFSLPGGSPVREETQKEMKALGIHFIGLLV
jgi:hypothetical protein